MKKLTSIFMSLIMLLTFVSCGSSNTPSDTTTSPPETTTAPTETTTMPSDTTAAETPSDTETGKALVVYFSGSGNTKRVAEDIAEAAGADLFEIIPSEPYTSADLNYSDSNSRVSREHDDESLRDVPLSTTDVENWDDYDIVFIGYPIWWGIAAWPVDGFVKANDFTGKTVIPFATSASSGMGQSGKILAELAGSGDWQDGQRFRSGADSSDVTEWVDSLGLDG